MYVGKTDPESIISLSSHRKLAKQEGADSAVVQTEASAPVVAEQRNVSLQGLVACSFQEKLKPRSQDCDERLERRFENSKSISARTRNWLNRKVQLCRRRRARLWLRSRGMFHYRDRLLVLPNPKLKSMSRIRPVYGWEDGLRICNHFETAQRIG